MQSSSVGVSTVLPVEDVSGVVKDDEPPPPQADNARGVIKPKAMKYRAKTRDILVLGLFDRNFYQGLAQIGYVE